LTERMTAIAEIGVPWSSLALLADDRHGHYDSHIPEVFPRITFSTAQNR
jgi:hypothetical protein